MARSSSSSAQQARERLAKRLSELRRQAGINGRELSRRCSWSPAKTSRLESATTAPSDADIWAWCRACGTPDQVADLIAANRQAEDLYVQWRRRQRLGMLRTQEDILELHDRTRVQRVYTGSGIAGFFQTPAYATATMTAFTRFQGTPDDVDQAVASRLRRQETLHHGDHRFVVLTEESALRHRIGSADVLRGQLRHLLEVMTLPAVALGIIPFTADRPHMWLVEPFYCFDRERVIVETLSAEITITAPGEIDLYERAFVELGRMAVYGHAARDRINEALEALA